MIKMLRIYVIVAGTFRRVNANSKSGIQVACNDLTATESDNLTCNGSI